jgi:hypothetical protein
MTRRALVVWLVLMAAETVHGALRQLLLAPRMGDHAARQVAVGTGSLLILTLVYLLFPRLGVKQNAALLRIGALWVSLTLVFEIGLGFAFGRPREEIFWDFNLAQGGLLPLGLLVMLLAPWIAARLSRT